MGLSEEILNLCGHEIWPPTHGDPTIKGPQPRIIPSASDLKIIEEDSI